VTTGLRSQIRSIAVAATLAIGLLPAAAGAVLAQPGTPLGTVALPGNGACSVAGSFDGTYYITTFNANQPTCTSSTLGIYAPPAGGNGVALLVSQKTVVDTSNNPVQISAVDWDAGRALLWGVNGSTNGKAWLIDLGDKMLSGPATATLEFNYNVPGSALIDGLAYDFVAGDVLHISPDVSAGWWSFSATGTPMGMVTVKNQAGNADGLVSGLAIGSSNTMYVARDGTGEIRRVNKSNGSFVSAFATTNFRVEDLTCDQTTYAPKEAILAKDAFGSSYAAFEVEPGTCPQIAQPPVPTTLTLTPPTAINPVGTQHCVTATVTDQFGEPFPGVTVHFDVSGSVTTSGDVKTDANGQAKFCYTGPAFPGADKIHAFADSNGNGVEDRGEPSGDATKTWVLPGSTPGCEVKINNGGWIIATNLDKSSFGGMAKADGAGNASGNEEYQDHGPADPMNLHGNVLVVVCNSATSATIYGEATIDGVGTFLYRLNVEDNAEPGKNKDKYWILVANGYDSGNQLLKSGNVQIHNP
jgi:hypothetical protein